MASQLTDISRLCVHTMTTKPWSLQEAITGFETAGIPSITVWRQYIEPYGLDEAARMLADSSLDVVSLCRGGFFPAETEKGRQHFAAISSRIDAIDWLVLRVLGNRRARFEWDAAGLNAKWLIP